MVSAEHVYIKVQLVYYTINNTALVQKLKKYNKFTVISLFLLQYYENITEITQRYVLCKLGIDRHAVAVSQASKGGQ